ncbi:hypothetical protein L198_04095 [Cryptococcus wingfieldii CBS 7118]|uniref:RNA polymerase II elongation factor ELL N-terminal domain-containing protein n=1 Tax=Cryptococcus wingfieldii CBS 7118 TaxID=1295528 RepID=A0A1E3J8X6_9TREE|nr:hypothetical protein L198_04095 [Cryptococcus wingfieldii CBS 7118]ODN96381.1 hypothetical protein L198_04095 [Cryptococcus wingfieldii CBS 7118]
MPLPSSGQVPLVGQAGPSRQAFLIKFPQDTWSILEASPKATVSVGSDGNITLKIPGQDPIPFESRPTSTTSEILALSSSRSKPRLSLSATASTRLNVPFTSKSTARAADRLRAQTDALDQRKKDRAARIDGSAPASGLGGAGKKKAERLLGSVSMAVSSSAPGAVGSAPAAGSVPLKTRVVQYLAMGETTEEDLCRRMGGDEHHVMRVVQVVGRPSEHRVGVWSLQPSQYAKIKLGAGQWSYTYAEQQQVIRLAHAAFDELGLPQNAEERMDLAKKEKDAHTGYGARSSDASDKGTPQLPTSQGFSVNPVSVIRDREKARTESPSPSKPKPAPAPVKKGPQSKIARERAKFVAERQRAGSGSLPNTKGAGGMASPRLGPTQSPSLSPEKKDSKALEKEEQRAESRKQTEKAKEVKTMPKERPAASKGVSLQADPDDERVRKRSDREETKRLPSQVSEEAIKARRSRPSFDYSSSSSDGPSKPRDPKRERKKPQQDAGKERSIPLAELVKQREKRARELAASDESGEEGEIRGRPKTKRTSDHWIPSAGGHLPLPANIRHDELLPKRVPKRPIPDHSASLAERPSNGHLPRRDEPLSSNASYRSAQRDPDRLRDRYEELYPAYQKLTEKLSRVHHAAEAGGDIGMSEMEIRKMASKWERWHTELSDIRRWFGRA